MPEVNFSVRNTILSERIEKVMSELNTTKDDAFLRYVYSLLFNKDVDDIDGRRISHI